MRSSSARARSRPGIAAVFFPFAALFGAVFFFAQCLLRRADRARDRRRFGASMAIPPAASAVVGSVAQDEVGKAGGANSVLRELGGVFGSPYSSPCSSRPAVPPHQHATLRRLPGGAGRHSVRMDDKVNLAEKFGLLDKPYSPGIVGYLNDYKLQVVKVQGPFVWHSHEDTDDFFLVLRGPLTIHLRDRDIELAEGELFVVPRGVEHCPEADEEAHVLFIEPKGTPNIGDAGGELTAEEVEL